jgi:probable F420-dependent oxidoreductase
VVLPSGVREADRAAAVFAAAGVDGVWATEAGTDPFLDLLLPVARGGIDLFGTGLAVAFARSPLVTAEAAWQLQAVSGQRFALGLGSSVKAHIERRYGMAWDRPGMRMREYVSAVRSLWEAFRTGGPATFQGDFYRHDLLPADFRPPLVDQPDPAVYLAAFNPYNCKTVGLSCDGMIVHPVVSRRYLDEVVLPAVDGGLAESGRGRAAVSLQAHILLVTGDTPAERDAARQNVRSMIAHYGSTRVYRPVFELHGWEPLWEELNRAAKDGTPAEHLVPDDVLHELSVVADLDHVGEAVAARYGPLVERVLIMNFDALDLTAPDALSRLLAGLA